MTAGGQNFSGETDGLGKVAGHFRKGSDEKIAKAVPFKSGTSGAEAMPKETGDKVLVLRECNHAVPQIAGGKYVEVLAQASAGTSVIRYGNDSRKMADEAWMLVALRLCASRRWNIVLKTA
jgi:hypothetical protein